MTGLTALPYKWTVDADAEAATDVSAGNDLISCLWAEIQAFLGSDPQPNQSKILRQGVIRHSMSPPRYFLDRPLCFSQPVVEKVNAMAEAHQLRIDTREEADGKDQGNFVLFDRAGNYLGRITTKGLTLTPQRFDETFFRAVMDLYLAP